MDHINDIYLLVNNNNNNKEQRSYLKTSETIKEW